MYKRLPFNTAYERRGQQYRHIKYLREHPKPVSPEMKKFQKLLSENCSYSLSYNKTCTFNALVLPYLCALPII